MKIRVNKKTATIKLESVEEIKAFQCLTDWYMDMVHEDSDEHEADALAEKLDEKFNPENY